MACCKVLLITLTVFSLKWQLIYSKKEAEEPSNIALQRLIAAEAAGTFGQLSSGYNVKEILHNGISRALANASLIDQLQENNTLSKDCTEAIVGIITDAFKKNFNKIQLMLDADGKPGSGINEGDVNWLGSYRECKESTFAHYCISKVSILSYKQSITLGLCVPKGCTSSDVFTVMKTVANITNNIAKLPIIDAFNNNTLGKTFDSTVYCDEPKSFSTGNIIAFCICGLFGMLVFVGTIVDHLKSRNSEDFSISKSNKFMPVMVSADNDLIQNAPVNENQPFLAHNDVKQCQGSICQDALLCFSFSRNAKQILNTDLPSSAISSLNGIRTISMFWVILGHTFFFALYAATDNPLEGFQVIHRFTFQAIANAYFSVDTFFLLSGLLVSYLSLRRLDKYHGESFFSYFGKKFLPQFYLHRFLRLTPIYMFVILFYIYIFPFCGDGPLWLQMAKGQSIENCKKYWWTNLLYINNFYPKHMASECIGWSWYLANDMQFYIISPLLIITMHAFRLPGTIIISSVICLASFSTSGVIIGVKELNALLTGDFQGLGGQAQQFTDLIYSKPYSRIPPYIVGLVLGYLLYTKKRPSGFMQTLIGFIGWTFAIITAIAAIYGPYTAFRSGGKPFSLLENILYGTFSRFSWGVCVAWVVYACHFGMGGVINSLLSWKAFIPLSRLTYCAYLVHPIIIRIFYSSFETPLHFSDISMAFYFTSFVMMTYASAFLLSVCVEFPFSNLEKVVFQY